MKNICLPSKIYRICACVFTVLLVNNAWAQNAVSKTVQEVEKALEAPHALSAVATHITPPVAVATQIAQPVQYEATAFPASVAPRFERMEELLERVMRAEQVKKLGDRALRLQEGKVYHAEQGAFLHSTFLAVSDDLYGYSGTVFKINYQGKEEIYGVIAAHVINRSKVDTRFVHKTFMAQVYTQGKMITIPAEIVQVGAPNMLDIALVKFRPEDEDLFEPLPLNTQEIMPGVPLRRQGFVGGKVVYMPERPLRDKNEILFSSQVIDGPEKSRSGFCGAAVVNQQNELVGIHVGSKGNARTEDTGFAVYAKFLQVLVEAYHHGGEVFYPFKLSGQTIVSLRPDEYISEVVLRNDERKIIYRYFMGYKEAYEIIERDIVRYSARYVEFTVRRVNWKNSHHAQILEDHENALVHKYLRTYVYDLQEQKIISQSKYTKLKDMLFNWVETYEKPN